MPRALGASELRLALALPHRPDVVAQLQAVQDAMRHALRTDLEDETRLATGALLNHYLIVAQARSDVEQLRVLYLDADHRLLQDRVELEGRPMDVQVPTRTIVQRALYLGAAAVILVHNHPSGDPTPSRSDIAATRDLKEVLRSLSISIADHVVVAARGMTSMRASGLI